MKKYQIIYADPPWPRGKGGKKSVRPIDPPWPRGKGGKKSVRPISSGGALEYPVLALKDIEGIMWDVLDYAESNSVLFLWAIDKYLFEAERLANNVGFKLHARMVWNKVTGIPCAFTIRFGHEYLLYMYRGKLLPVALEQRGKIHSVFTEQVIRHSQKPEIAYQIIECLYPEATKLELFARNKRDGWDCWGNEVESDIELCNPVG